MVRCSSSKPLNERGATMVEYVLLLSGIAIVLVASVGLVGTEARATFVEARKAMASTNFPGNNPDPVLPD